MRYFETKFLEEAAEFISGLDRKTNDPKLFKKLQNDIWEFRTRPITKKLWFLRLTVK